ncbi:ubiquitin-like protein [Leishmania major strain Friedlin]|uniref:Ubiquitin-like protein n=1 Tax=Leishmania major TaxID=5664 RepID=Q4QG81_LEIMA|nr:ubiquitin-like protein [Leishmania major strain Friedlin]CAG9570999.1 ubiquitin-like_protein [Leishmania major strain Friedlin]CAJ02698.1 ubiquitin-like protein [Leishmania major strain Friedlin]|eukprot:XP_001681817.1 ubiquitin-like protein [Leishmania major strain Friedlin]
MRIQVRGTAPYNSDDVVVLEGLTVAELRNSLMVRFNIDAATHSIRLLYRGRLMQDANSVTSYGVEEGSTVHIVVQPRQPEGGNNGGGEEHSAAPNQQHQFTMPQFSFGTAGNSGYNYVSGGGFSWQPFASTIASSISTAFQQHQQTAAQGASMPSATPPASDNSPHMTFSYEMGSNVPRSDGTAAAGIAGGSGSDAAAAAAANPAVAATVNAFTSQLPWLISSVLSNSLNGNAGAQQSQQQQQQQPFTAGATPAETVGETVAPAGPAPGGTGAGASADAAAPGQREASTPSPAAPQPPAAPAPAPAAAAGGAAPQPTFHFTTAASPPRMDVFVGNAAPSMSPPQYPQQQSTVVHIHVHCTPEELDTMPERLQRLSTQIPVGHATLQADTTDRNSYRQPTRQEQQQQQQQPRTTTAFQANNTSASSASDTQTPWINEAMSTVLATLGMPQLMQLAAGNYNVLANLRVPLQEQVRRRLNGTDESPAAVVHVVQNEARQLSERILSMSAVQNLMTQQTAAATSAGRTVAEASQRVEMFRQELPRYLEHFYVSVMQHLSRSSANAAEWSRDLRNIVVRYVGMVLSRSARWFEGGSGALQTAMANIMQTLLQSSGVQQQYPMLQAFSSMLSPMLQSLLGQWEREYDQSMRRSDDSLQFEQDAPQEPTSPPQAQVKAPAASTFDCAATAPSLIAESVSDLLTAGNADTLDGAAHMDDDFEDLAKELMEDADNDAPQPAKKAVTPKSWPLETPSSDVSAVASQTRLASAVEEWEEACDVPHSVADRVRAMATRYTEARVMQASPNNTAESASAPQAPPPLHAGGPQNSSTREHSGDWVMWEANPYGNSASGR